MRTQPAPAAGQRSPRESRTASATPARPSPTSGAGPLAAFGEHLGGDRLLATLDRDDEHGGQVDEDPGAAEQRQDDEAEAEDGRVEVEVPTEAAGDAGDDHGRMNCARGA